MTYKFKYSIILPFLDSLKTTEYLESLLQKIPYALDIEIICINNCTYTNNSTFDRLINFLIKETNCIFELINYGISNSNGEYIILLNENVIINDNNWIENLYLNLYDNSGVGVNMMEIHNVNFMYLFPSLIKRDVFYNYEFNNYTIPEFGVMDFCDLLITNKHHFNFIKNNVCEYIDDEKEISNRLINDELIKYKRESFLRKSKHNIDVLVEVITSNRSTTTLPITLTSILNQTKTPRVLLLMWNDIEEYSENNPLFLLIQNILKGIESKGTDVIVINSDIDHISKKHQFALETNRTNINCKYHYRIDDDCLATYNTLENLYNFLEATLNCYAVGPLVVDPALPINTNEVDISSKIEDIFSSMNEQWLDINRGKKEVDHLYSSFMFRTNDYNINYELNLSPVSHREETFFSLKMKLAGYSVYVDTSTKVLHYRNNNGGIRKYNDIEIEEYSMSDEKIFQEFLIKNNLLKKK